MRETSNYKEWKVKSKSEKEGYHLVKYVGGLWRCDCIAGQMGKECRHKRIVKNTLKGLKYDPKEY